MVRPVVENAMVHAYFDNIKSLEVRSEFLDISTAFDKVWYQGLIFKLKQNRINGNSAATSSIKPIVLDHKIAQSQNSET